MTTQQQLLGEYIGTSKANEIIMRKCIRSLADKGNKGAELIRTMQDIETGEDIASEILLHLLENVALKIVSGDGFVMFDSSPVWDNNEVWKITSRHLYGLNKDERKILSSDNDEIAEILTQLAQVKNQKSVEWNIMHACMIQSINKFLIEELTDTQRKQLLKILDKLEESDGKYNGVITAVSEQLGISKSAITQSMKLVEKKWEKRFSNWKPNTSYNKDRTYPKGQTLAKLERQNRKARLKRTVAEVKQDADQGEVIRGLSATKGNNFTKGNCGLECKVKMYSPILKKTYVATLENPLLTDEQIQNDKDYRERHKKDVRKKIVFPNKEIKYKPKKGTIKATPKIYDAYNYMTVKEALVKGILREVN